LDLKEDDNSGDSVTDSGAAYIFKNDGSDNWTEVANYHASDAQNTDWFGSAVSISDNYAVVGAYYEDGGAGDTASNAGAAYIFNDLTY